MRKVFLLWGRYLNGAPRLISIHETPEGAECSRMTLEATNTHLEPGTITYSITIEEVYE